ncbi:MAG: 50S ribosomal protein L35 [Elusimicrobiota bacterium]|nr:50S ribosomal protein L35 [Elusimicrobiota bacterium]
MANKNKTHSGTKKRFKVTSKGKVKRHHAGAAHLKSKKSPKRRRKLRSSELVEDKQMKTIKRLLGK